MTIDVVALLVANIGAVVIAAALGGWVMYGRLRDTPPSTYAEMERTLADMNRQMTDLRAQQAADHATVRLLRAEVNRLDDELRDWRQAYARLVDEFMSEAGRPPAAQPPAMTPAGIPAAPVASNPAALAALLAELFDTDEIDGLAFDMALGRYIRGESTEERARSLVGAAQRRGRLPELVELCRRERPTGGF